MNLRHSFRIGDYVRVAATTEVIYDEEPGENKTPGTLGRPMTCKKLYRAPVKPPIEGWIAGAVRRFEGTVIPACGSGEDYEPGYLGVERSKILWKVARSMMNVPVEAADEDVELIAQAGSEHLENKPCPMRLGTPWGTAGWSPEDQRKEMAKWPRDAKGHWLKKPKGSSVGPAS